MYKNKRSFDEIENTIETMMNAWNGIVSNFIPFKPEHYVKPVLYPIKQVIFQQKNEDLNEDDSPSLRLN